jgi:7-cyano-7-deazaguanine synthase
LTVAYGQRHVVEVEQARQVAKALHAANHLVLQLDLRAIGGSALTTRAEVPKDRAISDRKHGIPVTYVPGRNLIFLSLAAAHAEVVGAFVIYFGANILDYSGYPDCRPGFIRAFEAAVNDPVGALACGRCDSCLIRREGFAKAGVADPIAYAIP